MNVRARLQRPGSDNMTSVEIPVARSAVLEEVPDLQNVDRPEMRPLMPASGFRTLLVPLDGSSFAEHALPRALAIARRTGALIRLAHVYSPLAASDDPWELHSRHLFRDMDQQRLGEKQAYLNEVARRIARRDSVAS